MKNIKRTLWIAIVVGAFTLSAFAVDLLTSSLKKCSFYN